jgi:hypothetical protein
MSQDVILGVFLLHANTLVPTNLISSYEFSVVLVHQINTTTSCSVPLRFPQKKLIVSQLIFALPSIDRTFWRNASTEAVNISKLLAEIAFRALFRKPA